MGRLELDSDSGKLAKKSLDFRHYLCLKTPDHRRALTRMVLSGHSLVMERRRWKERGKPMVPPEAQMQVLSGLRSPSRIRPMPCFSVTTPS
jgi:hypothetical protein